MANFNRIILIGNLTRDPQLSYLPSQTAVCEFGLAVNRRWRGRTGNSGRKCASSTAGPSASRPRRSTSTWPRAGTFLVEGHLRFEQWESQDGQKRSKHRVMIEGFQFLDSGQGRSGAAAGAQRPAAAAPAPHPAQAAPPPVEADNPPPQDEPPAGEDIPF